MIEVLLKTARAGGAIASLFGAATQGVSMKDGAQAALTFNLKIQGFGDLVRKEETDAALRFAANCVLIAPEYFHERSAGWDAYFDVMDASIKLTSGEVSNFDDIAEQESMARIEYGAKLLRQWYDNQDHRLLPVFEAFGKINKIEDHLTSFVPPGDYSLNHNGPEYGLRY